MALIIFDNTDAPYKAWMNDHPDGFVVNTPRSSGYAMMHRSGCNSITLPNANYADNPFTGQQYIKVCADRPDILHRWVTEKRASSRLKICQRCKPDFAPSEETSIAGDLQDIDERTDLTPTTREALIHARVGQGKFRDEMLRLWDGECAATGLALAPVLVASHAKAWKDSDDGERLDPNNGLPLIATLDRLFDKYLMSVDPKTGRIHVSSTIDNASRAILQIPAKLTKAPVVG